MSKLTYDELFWKLYNAKNERAVEEVVGKYPEYFRSENWYPLGGNESNFGVVENQQSTPVAAIVEKLTNSIDAILMRKCYEAEIDPKSAIAPRSIEEAIERFFPDHKNWDLSNQRNAQAENIQVIADSDGRDTANTSLIIFDDGEGQHPENFEATFLSLLRGNKNEIHFVQGKYNMGGSGAIVFCGKKRYQLIASKASDGNGKFGFTLIRKHPLSSVEAQIKKNTWYEYLKIGGDIPSFQIDTLDFDLHNRQFRTGTLIKLYSYELKGNIPINRELARSINEFLYEPALPFYTVEKRERYPNDRNLERPWFGLKRQLEGSEYVETTFSEEYVDKRIGRTKVTVHVFKTRAKGKNPNETRKTIQQEYFKNNMVVLFSVNGQVHGHYATEFITRTLQYNILKDYLLIHVDCTDMHIDFRNELFMASRDRLKQGDESSTLRRMLGDNLKSGRLKDIYKRRKDAISVESAEDDSLLKNFAENLPLNPDMRRLLSKTFRLDTTDKQKTKSSSQPKTQPERPPFYPQRFPSFFNLDPEKHGNSPVIKVPLNGSRTVTFDSDVENQYFDRVDDPGELQIAVMTYTPNDSKGGTRKGTVNTLSDIFAVIRKSPEDGKIKVVFNPTDEVQVGDEVEVTVDLTAPGESFTEILTVKISDPMSKDKPKPPEPEEEKLGLPKLVRVYQDAPVDSDLMTWSKLSETVDMAYETVMIPLLEGDLLDTIYINMDSSVLKNYKAQRRNPSQEQIQLAEQKYLTSVYFHTLFLYVINRKREYSMARENEDGKEVTVELDEYLRDLFGNYYTDFLLNFGTSELMEALG